jgi:tetratricopeptide (TPR) repeat protein
MDRSAPGRLTDTQWEAWLAIGFNRDGAKKNLVIVTPAYGVKRGAKFAPTDATRSSQDDHLARLKAIDLYPAKPFRVGIRLSNLAALFQATNRQAEADPLIRRALEIDETSYGPDHPNVAIRLNNLARLLHDTNRFAEAEPFRRRALGIGEKINGPDHPNVAIRLSNLALLLQATNRFAEAEPLMRRALAIDEISYSPEHPAVARDLNNLALLLQATNRLAEAEPLVRRALAIFEASLGPDQPDTVTARNNLAALEDALKAAGERGGDRPPRRLSCPRKRAFSLCSGSGFPLTRE